MVSVEIFKDEDSYRYRIYTNGHLIRDNKICDPMNWNDLKNSVFTHLEDEKEKI